MPFVDGKSPLLPSYISASSFCFRQKAEMDEVLHKQASEEGQEGG